MTIQPISAASAALYFTSADLQKQGLLPDELTGEEILHLTRLALQQADLPLGEPLEVETFCDKNGLLIFARSTAPLETVWSFDDFEHLLSAARTLGEHDTDGALYRWDKRCWLILSGQNAQISAHLSEFGCASQDPYIPARLAECGTLILPEQALSTLRNHF